MHEYAQVKAPFLDKCTLSGLGYFLAGLSKDKGTPTAKMEHVAPSSDAGIVSRLENGEGKRGGALLELEWESFLCTKIICPC